MSIPVEKLVDARVDQFSWFFEDEELEFIRSHKGSFFEKKEAETFSKYICGITASTWWIRKRELERIEDKENVNQSSGYFNQLGMPAPAPWQNEKRIKIEVPEHERIPPAVGRMQFKRLSQELISLSKRLDEKVSICALTRAENNVASNIICLRYDQNEKKRVISSVQVFNYEKNHCLGLQLHVPSKISTDCVIEEGSMMIQDENPNLIRQYNSIYSPIIKTACVKLKLDWIISPNHPGRDPEIFSGPEFRDDQLFQATISIRPDLSLIDFPDEFKELRSDVKQLKVILDALTTEILPSSSKSSDDLSSLLRTSGNIEISDFVWQTCKYSSLSGITKNLNTLISLGTQGDASNITVLSDNDSDFAMKFGKARKRGIPTKIHEATALEMLFECGEQAVSRKLNNSVSSRAGLAQLLGSVSGSQRIQEQLEELSRRLKAVCLHHGLQTLALPDETIKNFIHDWIAHEDGEVTRTVSGISAYKVMKAHRPTSWSIKMNQYMMDIVCKTDYVDENSTFYVYEKTVNYSDS
ncbi:unnamed protein product [Oikopleura dioica]|uniref:Uncharacterized protein n=1 Tax=Oikopleura dioica TaxID=34765 RepID=E4YQE6_OIKDI|nr:unnamed protein product [Oikopleura dioica]